jgi:hypothetical protein
VGFENANGRAGGTKIEQSSTPCLYQQGAKMVCGYLCGYNVIIVMEVDFEGLEARPVALAIGFAVLRCIIILVVSLNTSIWFFFSRYFREFE